MKKGQSKYLVNWNSLAAFGGLKEEAERIVKQDNEKVYKPHPRKQQFKVSYDYGTTKDRLEQSN